MAQRSGLLLANRAATKGHSAQWITRHVKDRFVQRAAEDMYRSRSAYKLKQMDTQFSFIKAGSTVVDLGCFAGGWSQIAIKRAGVRGFVVGVDLVAMEPLQHHQFVQGDIRQAATVKSVREILGPRKVNVILSDMAPKMTGNKHDDHLASVELCREAAAWAEHMLEEGGWFITKIFDGVAAARFREELVSQFVRVRNAKPTACRKESRELYYVCSNYTGRGLF